MQIDQRSLELHVLELTRVGYGPHLEPIAHVVIQQQRLERVLVELGLHDLKVGQKAEPVRLDQLSEILDKAVAHLLDIERTIQYERERKCAFQNVYADAQVVWLVGQVVARHEKRRMMSGVCGGVRRLARLWKQGDSVAEYVGAVVYAVDLIVHV